MAKGRDRLLLVALVLSGCAALGDEIMWTRLCTLMLGSETMGVLAVLAGFFGGMALGAAVLHRRAAFGADPLGLFVKLELATAAFAALGPLVLPWLAEHVPAWIGPVAGDNSTAGAVAAAIAVAGAALLPGTFCMGATLAAVVEARRRTLAEDDGRGVGRLYAANTFGAVLGVLGTIHVVLPALGVAWGSLGLALASVGAAVIARRWGEGEPASRRPAVAEERMPTIDASRDPDPDAAEPLPLMILVTGAGFVGVGLEVIGVLVLSQLLENTIYTFAHVLAVYLLGTSAGAWLYSRFGPRWVVGRPATAAAALLVALAASGVLASLVVVSARTILASLAPEGASASAHMFAEACIAAAVFGVPTILMGALFSHAIGLVAPCGIGRAYALNTLGSAIAPFVFGVWAVAELGYRDAFFLVVYGYLLTFGIFTWFRRFKSVHQIAAIVGVIVLTTLGPKSLVLVEADEGWTTLVQHETPMGLVAVSEKNVGEAARKAPNFEPLRRLRLGRHFRMGGSFAFGERRMGHVPLLLHGSAERALFLGVGTGATLGSVRTFPLVHVDAVELLPAVLDELGHFSQINQDILDDERVTFHRADARRFVAATDTQWDVIVADLFHPGLDGAGGLYAREHFDHIAARLAPGGLFVQWLPLYQFDEASLRSVIGTFTDVFPEAHSLLGIYNVKQPAVALVGRVPASADDRLHVDVAALTWRLQHEIYGELLMQDPRDLLAAYLLDRDALVAFAGDAPRNTDLRPFITLRAPEVAYEGAGRHGSENLKLMLAARTGLPADLLVGDPAAVEVMRADVARFGEALAMYLSAEDMRVTAGEEAPVPATAIDGYLAAYAIAPEFAPTRGMLMAVAQQSVDGAERILPAMLAVTPDEPRVWRVWIAYLRRTGDEARLAEAQAEAQRRFGAPAEQ